MAAPARRPAPVPAAPSYDARAVVARAYRPASARRDTAARSRSRARARSPIVARSEPTRGITPAASPSGPVPGPAAVATRRRSGSTGPHRGAQVGSASVAGAGAHRSAPAARPRPIRCRRTPPLTIPDASLCASGVPARPAAGRRDASHQPESAGTGPMPGAASRGGSRHCTGPRNTPGRGRSAGRSAPTAHSARSCTTGNLSRAPPGCLMALDSTRAAQA